MKPMRLSIIGFGAVGQGVARALINKLDELKKSGIDLKAVAISDSHGSCVNPEGIHLEAALQRKVETGSVATSKTSSIEVIKDVEHELMIDVTPTNIDDGEPGLSYILEAFNMGRHVVTSNKGPLALKYGVLCDEA